MARRHGVRLHTHLCETLDEQADTLARFGCRPLTLMRRLGWTGDDVWYAHAVHMSAAEIGVLAHSRTGICHCPSSNMRLRSGIAPMRQYRTAGVRTALGVDGSASNDGGSMLAEARQAMLLSRLVSPDAAAWLTAREVLEIATRGGAAVLGRDDIGVLTPGRCADFFTIDLDVPAYAGALADPVAAVVFCTPQPARHTVVHGRVIVRDGVVTTLDMGPVVQEHNAHARRLLADA